MRVQFTSNFFLSSVIRWVSVPLLRATNMTSTSEASRSAADRPAPQVSAISATDDVRTIMLNEISWGAVFAGAVIGLVVQLILNMVGIGVGLPTVNAVTGDSPSDQSRQACGG
jgi:hypothetical protein